MFQEITLAVINSNNSEHYNWGNGCDGWHLVKSEQLSIIKERVPFGCSESRHYHQNAEQFFFVLSGIATMELDGEFYTIYPNNGLHVPAGKSHQLSNKNEPDLIFTVTSTPPSHLDRVET